ncbi:cartilage matrix protein-like [Argonauta hians]
MLASLLYIPLLTTLMVQLSWQLNFTDANKIRIPSKRPVDLVFLLDSSASIWPPNFRKQLDFVEYLVDQLDVGMAPPQVRVGVLSFSTNARVHFRLDESDNKEVLKSRLDTITQIRGNTNISDALYTMKDEVFHPANGGRRNVKRIGIMMTDGTSQNVTATQIAAEQCRKENITLFVIGIGRKVDYYELVRIANKPTERYLKLSSSYAALDVIKSDVIHNVIEDEMDLQYAMGLNENPTEVRFSGGEPPSVIPVDQGSVAGTHRWWRDHRQNSACQNKKADILFLLDSSSSIRVENLKKQVNVVSLMVRRFDMGPDKTRVGVSIYSHEYLPIFKIGELRTKTEILYAMKNIIYIGGGTKTGKALEKVRTQSFNIEKKRPDADKILIVFTDGQSSDYEKTREEAYLLKKSGVRIFVVSIGPNIDAVEIRDIASEPSKVFIHNEATFDAVIRKSGILTHKTCTAPKQIMPKDQNWCNTTQPTDVMFMISRNRFGQWKTNEIIRVISEIINIIGAQGPFQIGVTFDDCPADENIPIGSIEDKSELIARLQNIQYRPLSSMFRKIQDDIFSSGGSYSSTGGDSQKSAYVFIDNTIDLNEHGLPEEINKVLLEGTSIYAVVIGEKVDMVLLQSHLTKKENVIRIQSYDTLYNSLPSRFTSRMCSRPPSRV